MTRLVMGREDGRKVGIVVLAPLSDDTHFDIGHARIVVPCFSQLANQVSHTVGKRRIEITARNGRQRVLRLHIGAHRTGNLFVRPRLSGKVLGPVPAVQVVAVGRVLGPSAVPRLNPHEQHARNHLDILLLNALPAVVAVSDDGRYAVRRIALEQVPLHVFLDERTIGIRVFGPTSVGPDHEVLPESFQRIAESGVVFGHRDAYGLSVGNGRIMRRGMRGATTCANEGTEQGDRRKTCHGHRQSTIYLKVLSLWMSSNSAFLSSYSSLSAPTPTYPIGWRPPVK